MFAKNFTIFFLLLSMKIGRLKTSEDKNYEKKRKMFLVSI